MSVSWYVYDSDIHPIAQGTVSYPDRKVQVRLAKKVAWDAAKALSNVKYCAVHWDIEDAEKHGCVMRFAWQKRWW